MKLSTALFLISVSTLTAFPIIDVGPPLAVNAANGRTELTPGSYLSVSRRSGPLLTFSPEDYQNYFAELVTSDGAVRRLTPLLSPARPPVTALWFVIPADAPLGKATVALKQKTNAGEGNTIPGEAPIQIVATAPGLFTKSYRVSGPVLATGAGLARNALTNAAVPGQQIAIYATGLGGARTADVTVEVAGKPASTVFAGAQGIPGLDQINFIVPADAKFGCYVPLAIRVRGVLSNTVALSINDNPKGCAHPLGLSYNDLVTLDAGGSIFYSHFRAGNNFLGLTFEFVDADTIFGFSGLQAPDAQYYGCTANNDALGYVVLSTPLDAGPSITVSGPGARIATLDRPRYTSDVADGLYAPGAWQFSAPGGADLKSFAQSFTLPPSVASIGVSVPATVSKTRDLTVTWNPAGFGGNDVVFVSLFNTSTVCLVRAWEGSVTVPSALLSNATVGEGAVFVSLTPVPLSRPQYSLERSDGTRIPGLVDYGFSVSKLVTVVP